MNVYGTGTVYQAKKGWMIRRSRNANGKRHRYVQGPYPTEAAARAAALGPPPEGLRPGLTLHEWLEEWLEDRRGEIVDDVNSQRYTQYRMHIRRVLPCLPYRLKLDETTPKQLALLFTTLAQQGTSEKYRRNIRSTVNVALRAAVRDGLIPANPMDAVDREQGAQHSPIRILRRTDWMATIAQLVAMPAESRAVGCLIIATTGLRAGEACGLTWDQVDLDAATIEVSQQVARVGDPGRAVVTKKLKTKASHRKVSLPALTVTALRAHQATLDASSVSDHIIVNQSRGFIQPGTLTRWIKKSIYIPFGIPDVGLHGLRHTLASHLLSDGVDVVKVAYQLGHSNPATTMSKYAHVTEAAIPEIGAAIERLVGSD